MDLNDQKRFLDRAAEFATQPEVLAALGEVARNEETWVMANSHVDSFFAERGIRPPDDLRLRPIPWPDFGKPGPEWEPFAVRMTMCKKTWIRDEDNVLREQELCRGFEVVRNPIPGGPLG